MGKLSSVRTPISARRVVILSIAVVLAASLVHALVLTFIATEVTTATLEEEDREQTGLCIQQQFEEHLGEEVFQTLRDESRREGLAADLQALLSRHGGFRIKVYDEKGAILWSDEPRLIGRTFPDNSLLHRALQGEIVSKIEKPERTEHVYERDAARYVTETYVPIFFSSERPLGVVEVYRHSHETVRRISHIAFVLWAGAGVATLTLCGGLAVILGWGQRRALRLQDDLQAGGDELAREKAKLDAIVQGVGVGLSLIDRDHRILWANKVLKQMVGASDDLVGQYCYRICWGRDAVCDGCPSASVIATGQESLAERVRLTPNGQQQHLQIVAWPVRDPSGTVTHTLELIQDVTERVRLQAEVQQSAKLAAVGELAGGVAHEINNPTGIILATSTHFLSRAPTELREPLALIASNAERISYVTQALLRFSRRSEGDRKPLALNQVVEDCIPLLRQRVGRRIQMSVELTPSLPWVVANGNEIQQILINLVNNACDAMSDGGSLSIITRTRGTDKVAIEVTDTGHGIDPRNLDQIFTPFFTTKPAGSGTGLGLAISQRIAMAHGGHISAQSSPGRGATFIVELPAHHEEA